VDGASTVRHRSADAVGALAIMSVATAITIATVRAIGHLGYPLDDAYIHLRVSEVIRTGHYGLDPSAASAPSSSIVWPFLLAPFAGTSWHVVVPSILNIASLGAATAVASATLRRAWLDPRWQRWCVPAAVALVAASNAVGTALTGMEHSLQTLLVLVVARGVIGGLRGDPFRWWFWAAIAVAPMVRYESALVSGVALLVAWYLGARRPVILTGAAVAAGWAAFGAFLASMGLDPLPSSILVKSDGGFANLGRHGGVVPVVGAVVVVAAIVAGRRGARPTALGAGAVTLVFAGHLLAASTDEVRYATSIIALALVVLAAGLPDLLPVERVGRAAVGAVGALVLLVSGVAAGTVLSHSVVASEQIAQQQCRLHELVIDHLREPVAANDIGCISYRNDDVVLDLWGLASQEARRARLADRPGWMAELVDRHHVDVAMIYDEWFRGDLPRRWTKVGTLTSAAPGYADQPTVDIYATRDAAVERLRGALVAYAAEDHPGTLVQLAGSGV